MTKTEKIYPSNTVSLWLRGEHLEPNAITEMIGCAPSQSWCRGDEHTTSRGRIVTRKVGIWRLNADSRNADFLKQISEILSKIQTKTNLIEIGLGIDEAELSIFEAQDLHPGENYRASVQLDTQLISEIYRLGISLSFEIQVASDSQS